MKSRPLLLSLLLITLPALCFSGCANFRKLGEDLKFIQKTVVVSARITNADSYKNIKGLTFDWDSRTNKIKSADVGDVKGIGVFGFFVDRTNSQYICAYSDENGNGTYQPGEPAWIHSDASGKPAPLDLRDESPRRIEGPLSTKTVIPQRIIDGAREFVGDSTVAEAKSGWNVPVALGEVANLSEARFSAETGSQGYWRPAGYPIETGIGIFFLEKYDPNRIPVLFVYGAAGSPQDWDTFFKKFDRKRYQLWFYQYPSGERLARTGGALNRGVQLLQSYYGFDELNIVAHSMGGLVSREAVTHNYKEGNRYIKHFVTISSPFGGMKFAESGVKHTKTVIPSWIDMVPGSDFQEEIFDVKLKGKIPYMLIYGNKAKRSMILPPENDGTVSVESVTRKDAVNDAVKVQSFNEDHVSILSNPEVIRMVQDFLGQ
jgi:triacylglycerol esterase/lipase EstA (alpha/beta hydrolase family)